MLWRGGRGGGVGQERGTRPGRRSEPGAAVDALAEQVGMAVVPRVFLDHMDIYPAEGYLVTSLGDKGVIEIITGNGQPGKLPFPGQ